MENEEQTPDEGDVNADTQIGEDNQDPENLDNQEDDGDKTPTLEDYNAQLEENKKLKSSIEDLRSKIPAIKTDYKKNFRLSKEGIAEEDFPTGIICISDGDFDPTHTGKTNVDEAKSKLTSAGFSKEFVEKFTIVLWNIPNGFYSRPKAQFETTANDTGAYYFSGLSGSVISFITGHEVLTARQIFDKAMDQQVLNMVSL
jgi:hypothetical protein